MRLKQQEKQARAHYKQWQNSRATSLSDVYKTYSTRKARAWGYCEELRDYFNGKDLKVITRSVSKFTAGFQYELMGKPMFMYITADYDVAVQIEE